MSSIINAGVDGIVLTASSTAALNVQVGGTSADYIEYLKWLAEGNTPLPPDEQKE